MSLKGAVTGYVKTDIFHLEHMPKKTNKQNDDWQANQAMRLLSKVGIEFSFVFLFPIHLHASKIPKEIGELHVGYSKPLKFALVNLVSLGCRLILS